MLSYEICKQLKEAGFPQNKYKFHPFTCDKCGKLHTSDWEVSDCDCWLGNRSYNPTLSELIEACGDNIWYLLGKINEMYVIIKDGQSFQGISREEAVAKLYLAINKK